MYIYPLVLLGLYFRFLAEAAKESNVTEAEFHEWPLSHFEHFVDAFNPIVEKNGTRFVYQHVISIYVCMCMTAVSFRALC